MKQAISAILIPALLVSQSLLCVSHSHAGPTMTEPAGHNARAHVHIHITDHEDDHDHHPHVHGDVEKSSEANVVEVPPHDADAVYVVTVDWLNGQRVSNAVVANAAPTCMTFADAAAVTRSRIDVCPASPSLQRPKCALYLQLLSVRC